jgi:hypothetical protein
MRAERGNPVGVQSEAFEVAGIAAVHARDLGINSAVWRRWGRDPMPEAEQRLGTEAAAQARKRGLEIDAGYRVTRARELARVIERAKL